MFYCLLVCSPTLPKRRTLMSWNFEWWLPLGWVADGFGLKNIRIRRIVSKKIKKNRACTVQNLWLLHSSYINSPLDLLHPLFSVVVKTSYLRKVVRWFGPRLVIQLTYKHYNFVVAKPLVVCKVIWLKLFVFVYRSLFYTLLRQPSYLFFIENHITVFFHPISWLKM